MQVGDSAARGRFVEALAAEVALAAPTWPACGAFDTVYFGGGTPSLLAPADLARILEAARAHLPLARDPWILLEANPEDVTAASCAAWRGLGVETLSLGAQSFSDAALAFLGRRHRGDEARRAVETALAAGFHTVSVDLIFGLPGQAAAAWRDDLETVAALGPQHVSAYQLTVHARTAFGVRAARGLLAELPEDEQAILFERTHAVLAERGYAAYEVSNFARAPEHRSPHNRKYWDHTPYLGLGPAAHSFEAPGEGRPARRSWNERPTARWASRVVKGERPLAGEETLDAAALAEEALLLGLRTSDGVDLGAFSRRHGVDLLAGNRRLVEALVADGRLVLDESGPAPRLVPTVGGLAVADGVAAAFALEGR